MTAEAELERADADPGGAGKLRKVERLAGIVRKTVPRDAKRTRQTLGLPRERPDRIRQAVTLAIEQVIEQRLPPIGGRDR
ncbi:hypothetical protein BRDID11002_82360 [Bradyrhizobium diazoefficiens]